VSKRKDAPAPGPTERQPGETDKAFAAFRIYLEQGPSRSTATVGEQLGHRSSKQAEKWSARWRWVERVAADDNRQAKAGDEERAAVVAKRSRRQAEIAQAHQEVTAVVAHEVLDRVEKARRAGEDSPLAKLTFRELINLEGNMARAHARVTVTERLALGITTEQPGEPLPRSEAEEAAARLSREELDRRLAGVDELAARRSEKAKRAGKAATK